MVNTRNRPGTPEGLVEVESKADRLVGLTTTVQSPPRPNILGGRTETIPGLNLEGQNPVFDKSNAGNQNDG